MKTTVFEYEYRSPEVRVITIKSSSILCGSFGGGVDAPGNEGIGGEDEGSWY